VASMKGVEAVAIPSDRGPAMYARIPIMDGVEVASVRERVKGDAMVNKVEFLEPGTRTTTPPRNFPFRHRTIMAPNFVPLATK
jgi:hypothetical protein